MSVALRQPMTIAEFLAWEERKALRFEFDGFEPVAMVGGTVRHSTIQANLIAALVTALRGTRCRGHGSHLKIEVAGRIRYPDAFVVCSPPKPEVTVVDDPVVIFEIFGDSTAHIDWLDKNDDYRATPSVLHYVVLEQTHAAAVMFSRKGDDWVTQTIRRDGTIVLPEVEASLAMADIYGGLDDDADIADV